MNEKELKIRNKCRDICNCNNKEISYKLIKKEFPGCNIKLHFKINCVEGHERKEYMGQIMWKDISISF